MNRVIILIATVPFLVSALNAQHIIGCVDVERCLSESKKAKEQRDQLKKDIEAKMRALQDEKRRIDGLKEQIDLFTPGSDESLDLRKKIVLGGAQLEVDSQVLEAQTQRRLADLVAKLYEDVRREIKNVAEAKGLKLVLMFVKPMPKGRSDTDVMNSIMIRQVLYYDPSSDITAEVVNRLNN